MNVAFFLKPKSEVSFLYCDTPLPQALDIMQRHGYSSVPVIDREGRYVSTVREGDFLNSLVRTDGEHLYLTEAHAAETRCLQDVLHDRDRNPPCHIGIPLEQLQRRTMEQNFIPIVDDRGVFIGIVTRRAVINYLLSPDGAR